MGVFIGGVSELHRWFEVVAHQTVADRPYTWPASHPTWPPPTLDIRYLVYWSSLTRWQSRNWNGANTWPASQGGGAGQPHFGLVGTRLCTTSSPCVILSVTIPYFGHIEDMHGFGSIWCFSIIRCSWNGRSTKVIEHISNKHLSSISCMKWKNVDGKYMHFMTTNTPHTLRAFLGPKQRKELNPRA
jgi:hypothetical protein